MSDNDLVIEIQDLPATPVFPPRRGFFDLLPDFIATWARKRWKIRPTAYETWVVRSVLLRATFTGLYTKLHNPEPPAFTTDPKEWN